MSVQSIQWMGRTIKRIRLDQLIPQPEYQREIDENRRDRMKSGEFNPNVLRTILVSKRGGGKYAVLDGLQRTTWMGDQVALGRKQYAEVAAEIISGLSLEEEALLFPQFNSGKPVNLRQKFRSLLVGGDPKAKKIMQIVEKCGFKLSLNAGRPPRGTLLIKSIRGVDLVATRYGFDILEQVLQAIREYCVYTNSCGYKAVKSKGVADQFIIGLAMALDKIAPRYRSPIFEMISCKGPFTLYLEANAAVSGNRNGDCLAVKLCQILVSKCLTTK